MTGVADAASQGKEPITALLVEAKGGSLTFELEIPASNFEDLELLERDCQNLPENAQGGQRGRRQNKFRRMDERGLSTTKKAVLRISAERLCSSAEKRLIHLNWDTLWEQFVCPTRAFSEMGLSEGIPFKTCANPQACNRNINWANVYESEMGQTDRDVNYSGASPTSSTHPPI